MPVGLANTGWILVHGCLSPTGPMVMPRIARKVDMTSRCVRPMERQQRPLGLARMVGVVTRRDPMDGLSDVMSCMFQTAKCWQYRCCFLAALYPALFRWCVYGCCEDARISDGVETLDSCIDVHISRNELSRLLRKLTKQHSQRTLHDHHYRPKTFKT
jgi:hypothetical protein